MSQNPPRIRRVRPGPRPAVPERPPVATPERVDKVLSSLHYRKEASTEDIAAILSSHVVIATPILAYLHALNWVAEATISTEKGANSHWKLTFSGAKEAIFATHRARLRGVCTVFADGINPWTGVKTRNFHKNL